MLTEQEMGWLLHYHIVKILTPNICGGLRDLKLVNVLLVARIRKIQKFILILTSHPNLL